MKFDATYIVLILLALVARVVPLVLGGGLLVLVVRRLKKKDAQSAGESVSPPQSAAESGASPLDGLTLSQRLRQLRTAAGYSQELLAERLGVSRQAVSKWETGTAEPSTANLLALAELYGITVDTLLRGHPNP